MIKSLLRIALAAIVAPSITVLAPSTAQADTTRDDQWILEALDVAKAHDITEGAGTRIGLLDSGVDADHPDLKGNVESGRDMWNATKDGTEDALGHGTAMASLLVGHGHGKGNKDGVLGIAPEATVVPVTIYPEDFADDPDDQSVGAEVDRKTAEGLRWLVDEAKVDVVLMAFGGSTDEDIERAISYAADKDVAMFASTGYHKGSGEIGDSSDVEYPATDDNVTAVAGTTRNGEHWSHSDYGRETLISAPAEDVVAAQPNGKYNADSGTSKSAAIVAGVAALMDSQWPDMDWGDIQWRLTETPDDIGKKGWDEETGYGIVNPVKALTANVKPPEGSSEEQLNPDPYPRSEADEKKDTEAKDDKALTADSGGIPTAAWWIVGAVVLVAAIIVIAIIAAKRRTSTNTPPM